MFMGISNRLLTSIYLGICFLILYSPLGTLNNIQKTLTNSIHDDNPSYNADGYICSGIHYTTVCLTIWVMPSVVKKIGAKLSLILGSILNGCFISSFYFETDLTAYIGTVAVGFGAAILWTAQPNYIVLNSGQGNVDLHKDFGIFWIFFQSSHFFGNLITYLAFNEKNGPLDSGTRTRVITICNGLTLLAIVCFVFLKSPPPEKISQQNRGALEEIKKFSKIATSKNMIIFSIAAFTCGVHITFLNVFSCSLGFAQYLSENSKEFAPLCGLLQGVGEVLGGLICAGIGGRIVLKVKPLYTLGFLGNVISYVIVILTLPNSSLYSYTTDLPFLILPITFLLVASVLTGLGDACCETELYNHIGNLHAKNSAPAFAVYKFFKVFGSAVSYYYTKFITLHSQVLILIVLAIMSIVSYHYLIHSLIGKLVIVEDKKKKVVYSVSSGVKN